MLEKIQEFGETVTREQIHGLKKSLGEDLYELLDRAFESETEEEAKERIDTFVSAAKKSPVRVLKSRGILTGDQKAVIAEFMGTDS